MIRWSENDREALHLTRIMEALGGASMLVGLNLANGFYIEGRVASSSAGNNGGGERGHGPWHYYGSVSIETIDGATHVIDALDVSSVVDRWSALAASFERAGIIGMADLPA